MEIIGWHAFLAVLLMPPAWFARTILRPTVARTIGSLLAVVGLLMIVVAIAVQYQQTAGRVVGVANLMKSSMYAIVTRTDIPMLQFVILGSWLSTAQRNVNADECDGVAER